MDAIENSQKYLEKVRKDEDCSAIRKNLGNVERTQLRKQLKSNEEKKAFWINFYNAESQLLVERHPVLHSFKLVFSAPFSKVSGARFNLNFVEHGLLRRSKLVGNIDKPFARKFEKELRVEEVDPRIHFALNCGSESCPAIRFYEAEKIDQQLEIATETYLSQEVEEEENYLLVPRQFKWFSSDFGGKNGIQEFLSERGYSFENLEYRKFNWSISTRNFHD